MAHLRRKYRKQFEVFIRKVFAKQRIWLLLGITEQHDASPTGEAPEPGFYAARQPTSVPADLKSAGNFSSKETGKQTLHIVSFLIFAMLLY